MKRVHYCVSARPAVLLCTILLICILPVCADQSGNLTCRNIEMTGYALVSYCLPEDMTASAEYNGEAGYSQGKELNVTLEIDGYLASIHLLYPCVPPAGLEGARQEVEAFIPAAVQAVYEPDLVQIGGKDAQQGQLNSTLFAFYQPSNRTVAFILGEEGMEDRIWQGLLGNMLIAVNTTASPLVPGDCSEPISNPLTASALPDTASYTNSDGFAPVKDWAPETEARLARLESSQESMMEEMEATMGRLEEAKESLSEAGSWHEPLFSG